LFLVGYLIPDIVVLGCKDIGFNQKLKALSQFNISFLSGLI